MIPADRSENLGESDDEARVARYGDVLSFSGLFYPANEEYPNVRRAKLYDLYKLGFLHVLSELTLETPAGHIEVVAITGVIVLRQFIVNEEHKHLRGAVNQAREAVKALQLLFKQAGANEVQEFNISSVGSEIDKFEHLLEYDLGRQHAYAIEKIGIYDTDDLIEHAEDHLSESAKRALSERALQDFRAAGRCLAFNLFTASGYHSLRVLEAMARRYHKAVLKLDAHR